jgi:uncharacterized protein YxeA
MKNQLKVIFSVLIIIAVAFTAFTQQGKDKNNPKAQQQNQGKKDQKDNKGNTGVNDNKGNNGNNGNKGVKDNQGNNDVKNNNGRNDDNMNKGKKDLLYGYKWDRETFKDRRKIKGQNKLTVCHKFNGDNDPAVSIRVSSNALKAHMDHGDFMGDCPVVTNRRFSDIFLRKRTDYYNNLQESQEQVLYSRSMLDYALARLTESRSQLVVYQNSNMPPAYIEQRQATVVELEQNVSLLETLLGVAANLLVNKLQ